MAKNGMSLTEILRKCQRVDIDGSKSVAVVEDGVRQSRNKQLVLTTKTRIPPGESKQRYHYHNLRIYPVERGYTGSLMACPAVKVSCDCERHKFVYEIALWKRGAADVIYSNGKMPTETNPQLIPGCCKHLIQAIRYVFRNNI